MTNVLPRPAGGDTLGTAQRAAVRPDLRRVGDGDAANVPFIATLVRRQVDRFLGTSGTLQMIGLGVGAAVAGLFANSTGGLHLLAWINAGSFAVAGLIVLTVVLRATTAASAPPDGAEDPPARGSVWRDTAYLQLCTTQVVFVLASSSFVIILPLVALDVFRGPAWLPGVSIVAGNVVLAALQKPILSLASRRSRGVMLIAAVPFYAVAFLMLAGGRTTWGTAVIGIVLAAAVLGAVGEVVANALMLGAANDAAPAHLKGRYSALFQSSWGLAEVIAPTVFAVLLAQGNPVLWLSLTGVSLVLIPADLDP
jgi:hypothetical protein